MQRRDIAGECNACVTGVGEMAEGCAGKIRLESHMCRCAVTQGDVGAAADRHLQCIELHRKARVFRSYARACFAAHPQLLMGKREVECSVSAHGQHGRDGLSEQAQGRCHDELTGEQTAWIEMNGD